MFVQFISRFAGLSQAEAPINCETTHRFTEI
jgi:hypothetical protein